MKNNNTIKIKNELPELLEAVCSHPDCGEWLKDAIWDAFADQDAQVTYTRTHWAEVFEAMAVFKEGKRGESYEALNAEVIQ